jgi:hypothetical protein
MPTVVVVRHDLVDNDTKSVLLSNNIKVDSETPQKGMQRFTVTVTGPDTGFFIGNMELQLKKKAGEEKRSIELNVETLSPNVDTDSNSKTLSFPIQQGWGIWPWGSPEVNPNSPTLGEITLTLMQNGEGKATVEKASVLTMRGNNGSNLPDGALAVATQLPIELQRHEAKTLKVAFKGSNIPADEYNGLLHISVKNQSNAVQVPLRLQVKDGPMLALILLLFGPIVGIIFHWWNNEGSARYQLSRQIERMERQVDMTQGVQMDVKGQCHETLNNAKLQLIDGQKPSEIEKLLDPLPGKLSAAAAESEKFLKDEVTPLRTKATGMKPGAVFRGKMVQFLDDIRKTVTDGKFLSLDEARTNLDKVKTNVKAWEDIINQFNSLPDADQATLAPEMDKAETLDRMRDILQPKAAARALSRVPSAAEPQIQIVPSAPTWESIKLGLKVGRITVAIALYVFTLAVGYITLYAKAPTFGSDLANYITLFLWGASVNLVGAQAVDLKAIYTSK